MHHQAAVTGARKLPHGNVISDPPTIAAATAKKGCVPAPFSTALMPLRASGRQGLAGRFIWHEVGCATT